MCVCGGLVCGVLCVVCGVWRVVCGVCVCVVLGIQFNPRVEMAENM